MKIEESLDMAGRWGFSLSIICSIISLTLALLASDDDDGPIVCFLPSSIIYSFPYALCSIMKWSNIRIGQKGRDTVVNGLLRSCRGDDLNKMYVYMPRRVNFDPINWAESSESVAGY